MRCPIALQNQTLNANLTFGLPEEACRWYRKRFRIETMFSDFKGRGFQLQKSGLTNPAKIERLLIVVALAYVLVVYFGLYAFAASVA